MRANKNVRDAAREHGVKHWQIARQLGVGENTLIRWLREPLPPDKEKRIFEAIEAITKEAV